MKSPEILGQQAAEATRLLRRGDRGGAERIYAQVLAAMPRHPSSWSNLAALAVGLGEAQAGRSQALHALSLDSQHADAVINFGVASWYANQRRDAERAFRHALALSPGRETPALNLAQMWQGIARYDLAMDMLEAALVHNPGSSRLHQSRAETARLAGQAQAARHHSLAALAALLPELTPSPEMVPPAVDVTMLEAAREAMRTTMATVCDRLASAGIEYVLIGGTVLGIAREGEPFHGDKDIDLILSPDVNRDDLESLFADGFSLMRVPQGPDARRACMGWTDDSTGIGVDLFFFESKPDGGIRQNMGWPDDLVYDYPAQAIGTLHWRGRQWPVQSPLEDYLASNYGDDWREPLRRVGERSFDKRWFDTQISCPGLIPESLPRAINLVLLRLLAALRQQQWHKSLALCDQLLAREGIQEVEATRDRLLASGVGEPAPSGAA